MARKDPNTIPPSDTVVNIWHSGNGRYQHRSTTFGEAERDPTVRSVLIPFDDKHQDLINQSGALASSIQQRDGVRYREYFVQMCPIGIHLFTWLLEESDKLTDATEKLDKAADDIDHIIEHRAEKKLLSRQLWMASGFVIGALFSLAMMLIGVIYDKR